MNQFVLSTPMGVRYATLVDLPLTRAGEQMLIGALRDVIKASTYSDSVDHSPRLREAWFLEVEKALHDKYDASKLSKGTRYRITGPDGEVIAAAADALTSPLNPPATTGYGRYSWFRGDDGRDDEGEDDFEDEEDSEDDLEDEEMGQAVANG